MNHLDFSDLADEVLRTFGEAADMAKDKLDARAYGVVDSFAAGNTFTTDAFRNLDEISRRTRESWLTLMREPAISRLVIENDEGTRRVLYIARKTGAMLPSGTQVANYDTALGSLAELDVGDEKRVLLGGNSQTFILREKTTLHPRISDAEWDSTGNLHLDFDGGAFSIRSFRELLHSLSTDTNDDLDRLLEQAALREGIKAGISHQLRVAMGLRDQPILDKFQGEIFRRPLDSQLIILGPPGTGKTTTLIKRLGQKLDLDALDEGERRLATASPGEMAHDVNWMMFTPSELLKHYLKEAFNREQVAATDARIQTWEAYRTIIARNTLGILRSANGGRYSLQPTQEHLSPHLVAEPREWFEAFSAFHDQRLRAQLKVGTEMVGAAPDTKAPIILDLITLASAFDGRPLMDIYRDLEARDEAIRTVLSDSREIADRLLKGERNRLYNRDKEVFIRLTQHLSGLQQDEDQDDDDAEFDDDDVELADQLGQPSTDIQAAVKAYLAALRALSRSRYQKRSMQKHSRAGRVIAWLGDSLPDEAVIMEIGQRITFQNGLRRFVNALRRYVADVPNSYRAFRREAASNDKYYVAAPVRPLHLCPMELDAVILLMLGNSRRLLGQPFVSRNIEAQRFDGIKRVASLFRTQIMVDEATDFSALELACMEGLAALPGRSFFACGDFNQRITATGIRSMEHLAWISNAIAPTTINLVYRQSRKLNAFAGELLKLMGGDLSAHGELPENSTHDGIPPALLEHAGSHSAAWIADRIIEVERTVREMPTIAVLVNREEDAGPMADQLTKQLEAINLRAVACNERTLGEGTDVRVFAIHHIKGLEFEAVFFVGVDRLAEMKPHLFDRYLYVGATRAATYLAVVCTGELPSRLEGLRPNFCARWEP